MRIAIVNDTLMSVIALKKIVELESKNSIIWIAYDGEEAVKLCAIDTPDIILMDIIMPVMDGVEATKEIMKHSPCAILLVTSSVDSNASKVFEAMGAGALDAINTPVIGNDNIELIDNSLLNKIKMIGKLITHNHNNPIVNITTATKDCTNIPLVVIGASTGGPTALVETLKNIPKNFPASFIIVQHVDKEFISGFINWLNDQLTLPVRMAVSGDKIEAGTILVSDSAKHLILSKDNILRYTNEPVEYPYIPSVNVFFESVAQYWDGDAIGILLTGMGRDGAQGLLKMKNKKFTTITQKESTCAVYGMPKAAVDMKAADLILSPVEINKEIMHSYANLDANKITKEI